eukprot:TRINITY_DN5394_c0_g1_i2.p1 TRINITY_DN5394_c0_g1~~TRINITY_DN5394_c0_g1_i2.p1  ORF type:complete len:322 (-),score=73.94 TRINITY_DN5394_c0_g1_i2:350-1315(-)
MDRSNLPTIQEQPSPPRVRERVEVNVDYAAVSKTKKKVKKIKKKLLYITSLQFIVGVPLFSASCVLGLWLTSVHPFLPVLGFAASYFHNFAMLTSFLAWSNLAAIVDFFSLLLSYYWWNATRRALASMFLLLAATFLQCLGIAYTVNMRRALRELDAHFNPTSLVQPPPSFSYSMIKLVPTLHSTLSFISNNNNGSRRSSQVTTQNNRNISHENFDENANLPSLTNTPILTRKSKALHNSSLAWNNISPTKKSPKSSPVSSPTTTPTNSRNEDEFNMENRNPLFSIFGEETQTKKPPVELFSPRKKDAPTSSSLITDPEKT